MVQIGKRNRLKVTRLVDFGAYLDAGARAEILLPKRYITTPLAPGDEVDVVVYTDSEDRPVASTEVPKAYVGEFAFLDVAAVTKVGAFMDWGLPKDLLVPFSEQRSRMVQGGNYLVYLYVDNASGRVAASAKVEKFVGNVIPEYANGQKVSVLVFDRNEVGYRCIVDNLHFGILYEDEVYSDIHKGDRMEAYVKRVRPDGKIDLMLGGRADVRTNTLADRIEKAVRSAGGSLAISDKSSPEEIKATFQCSKKDFKKAVGHLLKDGKIGISPDKTALFAK
ncbi:MAG: GntR family transcriptional regulator [Muribaculaceae bacterium]|jgi:predicted RNA-binding protein (virulence factor B family)|nr:GntR family transcriptional regulator [Muribaculaceae bacterium]